MKIETRSENRNGRGVNRKFILNEETGVELSHGDWADRLGIAGGTLTAHLRTYTIEQICNGEHKRKGQTEPGPAEKHFRHRRWA